MSRQPRQIRSIARHVGERRLVVWGERRPDPDWDQFLRTLIALALKRVEERERAPEEAGE
jgi:hypothetical protein